MASAPTPRVIARPPKAATAPPPAAVATAAGATGVKPKIAARPGAAGRINMAARPPISKSSTKKAAAAKASPGKTLVPAPPQSWLDEVDRIASRETRPPASTDLSRFAVMNDGDVPPEALFSAQTPDEDDYSERYTASLGLDFEDFKRLDKTGENADGRTPPGSDFEPWVWQSLERDGHILIEVRLDDRLAQIDWELGRKQFRYDYAEDPRPSHDRDIGSVLVSVPQPQMNTPWPEGVRRLMLVVCNYNKQEVKPWHKPTGRADGRSGPPKQTFYSYDPLAYEVPFWMSEADERVIYGRTALHLEGMVEPMFFWTILPWADVQQAQNALDEYVRQYPQRLVQAQTQRARDASDWRSEGALLQYPLQYPPLERHLGGFSGECAEAMFILAQQGHRTQWQILQSARSLEAASVQEQLLRARLGKGAEQWTSEDVLWAGRNRQPQESGVVKPLNMRPRG